MNSKISKGKWTIISVGVTCCLISLFVIAQYLAVKGISIQTVVPRAIRFILTVLMFVMIYRGVRWVTWISVFLFGITGIYSLTSDLEILKIIGGIYLSSAVMLMLPQVKDYQNYKKQSKITFNRQSPSHP